MPNLNKFGDLFRYSYIPADYAGVELRIMARILLEHEKLHPESPLPQGVKITSEGRVEIDPHEVIRGQLTELLK